MKKLKINPLTYFFLISICLTGLFKEGLILIFIITCHEIGHILAIKYFHYEIKEIDFLPFGGFIKIDKRLNSSISKEMIISLCGILMQLFLYIIFSFFYYHHYLSREVYQIFNKYNFSILIFNLLPIIPLDGSVFLKSVFEKFFSFWQSQILLIVVSFIFLVFFFSFNYYCGLNNYLIGFFLFYKISLYLKNLKYLENRFLLERYLYNYDYEQVKIVKGIRKMQKERKHYFKIKDKLIAEKDVLEAYFTSYLKE